jgi:hypothetical protein
MTLLFAATYPDRTAADFLERGSAQLKGVPGEWPLFAVSGVGDHG